MKATTSTGKKGAKKTFGSQDLHFGKGIKKNCHEYHWHFCHGGLVQICCNSKGTIVIGITETSVRTSAMKPAFVNEVDYEYLTKENSEE